MASINQIRGALLEEIVLLLLDRSGYRSIKAGEEGTRNGRAGLEVEGRGSHHQIDALVSPVHSHAFIYPIRLMVEAKCETSPVGLATVRSVVGTLFDINQNFLARRVSGGREVRVQRFNYHAANVCRQRLFGQCGAICLGPSSVPSKRRTVSTSLATCSTWADRVKL